MLYDQLPKSVSRKRRLSGEHLVDDDTHRIDIRLCIDLARALGLFGRHVVGSPEHGVGLGAQARMILFSRQLGNSEVEDFRSFPRRHLPVWHHHDVVRFEVSVNSIPIEK